MVVVVRCKISSDIKKTREGIGKGTYSVPGPLSLYPSGYYKYREIFVRKQVQKDAKQFVFILVVLSSGYSFLCFTYLHIYCFIYNLKALRSQDYATKVYAS